MKQESNQNKNTKYSHFRFYIWRSLSLLTVGEETQFYNHSFLLDRKTSCLNNIDIFQAAGLDRKTSCLKNIDIFQAAGLLIVNTKWYSFFICFDDVDLFMYYLICCQQYAILKLKVNGYGHLWVSIKITIKKTTKPN